MIRTAPRLWGQNEPKPSMRRGRRYHRPVSAALVLRLALAPTLVAIATLAARRWGPAAGGWVASLPVVAGPVLLVFIADHGPAFGAQAGASATLGLVSLAVFTTVYARVARSGRTWGVCLLTGWLSFLLTTAVLALVAVPAIYALAAALVAFQLCRVALGRVPAPAGTGRRLPADIPLRMLAALVMVIGLSVVSGPLGSRVSGLVAPFPIIGSVMAAFTHASRGREALQGYSATLLRGLPSLALFTAWVAFALQPLGLVPSFALGSLVAALSHAVLIAWSVRPGGRHLS